MSSMGEVRAPSALDTDIEAHVPVHDEGVESLHQESKTECPGEVATMSTPSVDPTHYYPSYVNPHPALSMEQFRLIQQAWKRVKDGQFEVFTAQTLVADPLGFWGLQFYDTLFALDSALKPLFTNTFTQSKMLTEMVDAALGLLPGVLDQALGAEKTAIDPQLLPMLVDLAARHVSYSAVVFCHCWRPGILSDPLPPPA